MTLTYEQLHQKVEELRAGLTVLIDDIPVKAAWIPTDFTHVPCNICPMKCNLYESMTLICTLLDEPQERYAYLVLDEKELGKFSYTQKI